MYCLYWFLITPTVQIEGETRVELVCMTLKFELSGTAFDHIVQVKLNSCHTMKMFVATISMPVEKIIGRVFLNVKRL